MKGRNVIGAAFLILGWLAAAAALVAHPETPAHSGIQLLAMATGHRSELQAFAALNLASAVLFAPAMVLLSGLPDSKSRVFLPLACILVLIGSAGHAAESSMNLLLTAIASIPADTSQKAAVLDSSTGMIAPVLILAVIFDIALIVFAAACWRAKYTSFWPLVIIGVGSVAGNFAPGGRPVLVALLAAITAGIVWIAIAIGGQSASGDTPSRESASQRRASATL
jgi:hypothetical protein